MNKKRVDRNGRILPENISQRKDGSYMWKKIIDGKQYCEYAKTLGEIKEKKNEALYNIDKGKYKNKTTRKREAEEKARKDYTLNEWFSVWEKEYRIGHVRNRTVQHNHNSYMKHFYDNIGQMKINEIKQVDIVKRYNQIKASGKRRASMERYHTVLHTMLAAAVQNDIIKSNPAAGALKLPPEKAVEKRILTEDEEKKLFDYLDSSNFHKRLAPLLKVALGTGMRIGEILALQWSDIDFDGNVIHVSKNLSEFPDYINGNGMIATITEPKTQNSNREIPMLPEVKNALLYQKQYGTKCAVSLDGYSDFVFCSRHGTYYRASNINGTLDRIVSNINQIEEERAQMEGRVPIHFERFSPHSLRHTFATRCYERGVKEKVVQKILGHKRLDITLNTYTHVTDEMIREDIKKME